MEAYELVFCTPIGTPLDGSNVRKLFAAHLRQPDCRDPL